MSAASKLLRASLKRRGLTLEKFCHIAGVAPSHFSPVLSGKRAGRHTWKRLKPHLTDRELEIVLQHFPDAFPAHDA